jgi:hypothetical protein
MSRSHGDAARDSFCLRTFEDVRAIRTARYTHETTFAPRLNSLDKERISRRFKVLHQHVEKILRGVVKDFAVKSGRTENRAAHTG